jgi:hypothetical protein
MLGGRANGVGEDVQRAEWNARQVPDGVPEGRAGRGRSDGGQDERLPNLWLQIMVPDGVTGGKIYD